MKNKPKLGRLQRVELRDYWEREDTDFTPWLASEENIALLSNVVGLELEVQQEEASVGPFRADILCRDTATDALVIIENQLEKTDHTHLGQTITYASGLDAVNIIWVASRFTEEHRAALDWLNRITHEDIRFFGIEIELWCIGASVPAPKFNIVAKPNDWSKTVKEAASRRGALTAGQQAQILYWSGFGAFLESQQARFKSPKPAPSNWMAWGIGRSGSHMIATVNAKEIFVHIELNNRKHPTWFHKLHKNKEEIEKETGFSLEWNERPNRKYDLIRTRKKSNAHSEDQHEDAFAWMLERMSAIESVFRPRVKELDDSPLQKEENSV